MNTLRPLSKRHPPSWVRDRLRQCALILGVAWFVMMGRLVTLQWIEHQHYQQLAEHNALQLEPIPAQRGHIMDRHGQLLAGNAIAEGLFLDRRKLHDASDLIKRLQTLAIPPKALDFFSKRLAWRRRDRWVPIVQAMDPKTQALWSIHQSEFPELVLRTTPQRWVYHPEAFYAVLGRMGALSAQDLAQVDPNQYAGTQSIGKQGLEKTYEAQLHGQPGLKAIHINARGQTLSTQVLQPATSGANLTLTLDAPLQRATAHALHGLRGAAVALEPQTGGILALVSSPSPYDAKPGQNALFNRAIRGQYPPASTLKPLLALKALDEGVVTPAWQIHDAGWFRLPSSPHIYHDWLPEGHGWVNLHKAIATSCDTYFYQLAQRLGISRMDEVLSEFGMGQALARDLPQQTRGLLASPTEKLLRHQQRWYLGDTIISGIGQGDMLITPLQLASIAATIASRGQVMQPFLVQHITDTLTDPPTPLRTLSYKPQHWRVIISAMQDVIRWGTGFRVGKTPYTIAGKTGTAQRIAKRDHNAQDIPKTLRDHSLFMGFAPVDHPKIAVGVVVENSPDAPRIARAMLDAYLRPSPKEVPHAQP